MPGSTDAADLPHIHQRTPFSAKLLSAKKKSQKLWGLQALPSTPKLTPEEEDRIDMMHTFVLNGAHFYCETADVTRPFPSAQEAADPSWEFVWNRWLAGSFAAAGCGFLCPHLLQVPTALLAW